MIERDQYLDKPTQYSGDYIRDVVERDNSRPADELERQLNHATAQEYRLKREREDRTAPLIPTEHEGLVVADANFHMGTRKVMVDRMRDMEAVSHEYGQYGRDLVAAWRAPTPSEAEDLYRDIGWGEATLKEDKTEHDAVDPWTDGMYGKPLDEFLHPEGPSASEFYEDGKDPFK